MVMVTEKDYYMNEHLKENLDEVPRFLRNGWDCVIIVSGHSKVRIGKSTFALQMGYYLSWIMAKINKRKVDFGTKNVCFTPDELITRAGSLPRNSVIIYDEAMTGLNSSRAMESINKTMMDFFIECGQYGHIIIIVLPNFFRLAEDIAIPRSLFLCDVYTDLSYQRGFFKFYNEIQKEFLYMFGKKRYGTFRKYQATNPSFSGKYTKFVPIDKERYEKQKREAIQKKRLTRVESRMVRHRNALTVMIKNKTKMTDKQIAEELSKLLGVKVGDETIRSAIWTYHHPKER